jgi:cobalt-zinc-cadmium efflux system membrane fusion protein
VTLTPLLALLGVSTLVLGCGGTPTHGTITPMSVASSSEWRTCEHRVPEEVCVRCRPERAAKFKARGDWCPEHSVPESQCLECHPDLDSFLTPSGMPAASSSLRPLS